MLEIMEVDLVDDDLVAAMARLLPQLSTTELPDRVSLQAIADSAAVHLLVARQGEAVVGTLTLAIYRTPTGVKAWIEDVVVDKAARGSGVGAALVEVAISKARSASARYVGLTTRPSRKAANKLYEKLGFVLRGTNVYRYELT